MYCLVCKRDVDDNCKFCKVYHDQKYLNIVASKPTKTEVNYERNTNKDSKR